MGTSLKRGEMMHSSLCSGAVAVVLGCCGLASAQDTSTLYKNNYASSATSTNLYNQNYAPSNRNPTRPANNSSVLTSAMSSRFSLRPCSPGLPP